ncbi:hypothetical protein KP79_PYT19774 [Mizuhopecten yessoensis]|uniref:Uncharacterized protein n=1 Tax=Mizuhopecten yessoensis TaxID=6573 RepID=A0A210QVM0_MIZYE|nr:hypothetical protein KP79_PYT19774 [Mizuhopecten yessoensis]
MRLVEYIERQWIDDDVFPPASWTVFRQSVRTNNDVGGWLHRLNVKAGHGTTLFYRLVPLLVREATIVETSVAAEDFSRDNRAVNSRMEKQLTAATDSYMTDGLSTTAFLRKCAALYTCRLDGAEEDEARDQ